MNNDNNHHHENCDKKLKKKKTNNFIKCLQYDEISVILLIYTISTMSVSVTLFIVRYRLSGRNAAPKNKKDATCHHHTNIDTCVCTYIPKETLVIILYTLTINRKF